jgi:hypothetical protein
MTDEEMRQALDRIVESADKLMRASNVFADAANTVIEAMITSQDGAARAIAASIKRTQKAKEMLDEVKRENAARMRGDLKQARDGQVVELPRGRK